MKALLLFILLPAMVSAQYWYRADTTCYSDMYVAAAISEFSPIPSPLKANIEIQERDTSDLFELLYELNREKLLPIYDWPVTTIPSTINEKEVHKLLESAPNVHSILDHTISTASTVIWM